MVGEGIRNPRLISDSEYGEFCKVLKHFLSDDASLPHRPEYLVAEQAAFTAEFNTAVDVMNFARNEMVGASLHLKNTITKLDKKVRWMRNIIPTLVSNKRQILISFGLDVKVPRAYEELKNYADAANGHWQTVKLDPLFAPVAAGCNELADLIAEFEANENIQMDKIGEYHQKQNAKDLARLGHQRIERAIFRFYVAFYPDGQEDYWTQTPWGRAPKGKKKEKPVEPT
jgi:hypothetical protein